jgi:hypothetical protein
MTTLMIKDLPQSHNLDHKEMARVTGGMGSASSTLYTSPNGGPKTNYEGSSLDDWSAGRIGSLVNDSIYGGGDTGGGASSDTSSHSEVTQSNVSHVSY